jgi:uncharacterized protein YkwD
MRVGVCRQRMPRAFLALAGASVLALLALAGAAAGSAAAGGCAHARDTHADASLRQLAKATVCLVNHERAQRDKGRLDENRKLRTAASRHTDKMLAKNCFRHRCPGEPGLEERIRRTGYLNGAKRWRFAENMGCALNPKKMVDLFMTSKFNRRNLLNHVYRDVGAATGKGAPGGCSHNDDLTTFTVVFAWRTP